MHKFGFAVAKYIPFFQRCAHLRWTALAIAVTSWAMLVAYLDVYVAAGANPPDWQRAIFRGIRELQAWTSIVAIVGFSHHYLRDTDGPVKRLLTLAIFPFYLIHQTIIVVAAHYLDELRWPLVIEAPVLIGVTALGCWLFFDLGRRIPALRIWIGLSHDVPTKAPPPVLEDARS